MRRQKDGDADQAEMEVEKRGKHTIQIIHAVNTTHDGHHMPIDNLQQAPVRRFIQFDGFALHLIEDFHGLVGVVGVFLHSWVDTFASFNVEGWVHARGYAD